jgi:hypothetical protein
MVGGLNPAFGERDTKQAMIDLPGISTNWLKTSYICTRLSWLRALEEISTHLDYFYG